MSPVNSRSCPRALIASLFLLTAAAATAATAPPVGIYPVSVRGFQNRPTPELYRFLSGDGSIVRSDYPNRIWTYPDGAGTLFPAGSPGLQNISDASPDMATLLGRRSDGSFVVASRDGSQSTVLEIPEPFVYPFSMSPNGRFAAGKPGIVALTGLAPDVGRWTVGGEYQALDRGPDFVAGSVVSVTDDGTVYGQGYIEVGFEYSGQPFPYVEPAGAVRWNPDGTLERLAGTDALGRAWRQGFIDDISPDGSFRVGTGTIQRDSGTGSGLKESLIAAVFEDSGPSWVLWEQGVDTGVHLPRVLGVSADGALVYGNVPTGPIVDPISGLYEAPLIWSRGAGQMSFEIFLRSMGVDTTNWKIGPILDMSDDGKTVLAYGSAIGANGYQVLIVIPEPSAALLLGLGLISLTWLRARD